MLTEKLSILKASPKDWELYKQIRLDTLKQEPQAFSSKYEDALLVPNEYWKNLLKDDNSIYLLAKIDKKVGGVIRLTFNDEEENIDTAIIGGFYVNKEFRKLGLGRKLLEKVMNMAAKRKDISKVRLYVKETQTAAIELYKDWGFEKIGIKDEEIVMEKSNQDP